MSKLKKSGNKVAPLFTVEDMFSMGKEYAELSKKNKVLSEKIKDLSAKIKSCVQYYGTRDDKGSYYIENDSVALGSIAKVKVSLDQEKGIQILRDLGLDSCIKTTYVIDEDALEEAVSEGKISLNKVQEFTVKTESYSVSVKSLEEMPEVEQTSLKSVARRKKNG